MGVLKSLSQFEIWFAVGSQHLYGPETLENVALHSREIAESLSSSYEIPLSVVFKSVLTTPDEIYTFCQEANNAKDCAGVMLWMHTFSPAKMWINGLKILKHPILHLHTQYNAEIPWDTIDMDFMNENQSAHGGREFGFMMTRMKINRKVVVGHWKDDSVHKKIGDWSRVAAGWRAMQELKVARIGDNMRGVAVTEGDKVEAQMRLGFSVNGFGLGDLLDHVNTVSDQQVKDLLQVYSDEYQMSSSVIQSSNLYNAAQIEIGLRGFLQSGGFGAFTDTFENLTGLNQLPGIAVQRLMSEGYGFGAEGDWKTAALLYAMKTMDQGLAGGTSFMEDYTYDFNLNGQSRVLGSHMLEVCPTIASGKPTCEIHPLGIGGKADPARLVFDVAEGAAINVSLIDMGNRFRLLVNEVNTVNPPHLYPNLPVARVLWQPLPDMETAAEAWILAGGAHHTVFSKTISTSFIEDLAEMAGLEVVVIDEDTKIRQIKDIMRTNEVFFS